MEKIELKYFRVVDGIITYYQDVSELDKELQAELKALKRARQRFEEGGGVEKLSVDGNHTPDDVGKEDKVTQRSVEAQDQDQASVNVGNLERGPSVERNAQGGSASWLTGWREACSSDSGGDYQSAVESASEEEFADADGGFFSDNSGLSGGSNQNKGTSDSAMPTAAKKDEEPSEISVDDDDTIEMPELRPHYECEDFEPLPCDIDGDYDVNCENHEDPGSHPESESVNNIGCSSNCHKRNGFGNHYALIEKQTGRPIREERRYWCKLCDNYYPSVEILRGHIKGTHGREPTGLTKHTIATWDILHLIGVPADSEVPVKRLRFSEGT